MRAWLMTIAAIVAVAFVVHDVLSVFRPPRP